MLKMIIVDDEPLILDSLQTLLDWNAVGVQVVGCADNGAAAIDMAIKLQPDIILSDIAMPYLSGIDMLENIRRNAALAEVIFISAYSKFEYAQKALKFGAFDYLLKPINEAQLLEIVSRCAEKIKADRAKAELARQHSAGRVERRHALLLRLVLEARQPTAGELAGLRREGLMPERYAHMVAACVWHGAPPNTDPAGGAAGGGPTGGIAARADVPAGHYFAGMGISPTVELLLLLSPLENADQASKLFSQMVPTRQLGATVAVSGALPYPQGFEQIYHQICIGHIASKLPGALPTVFPDICAEAPLALQNPEDGCEDILARVAEGVSEGLPKALFGILMCYVADGSVYDAELMRLRFIDIAQRALAAVQDYRLPSGGPAERQLALRGVAARLPLNEVFETLSGLLQSLAGGVHEARRHSARRLINQAVAYIKEHYGEDLTLAQVAGHLYISPTYLSKVFSTDMGQSFSHYLQSLRISEAKRLLRDTHLKIYEVATAVGYGDVPHFSKSFKQLVGRSPIKYRQQG